MSSLVWYGPLVCICFAVVATGAGRWIARRRLATRVNRGAVEQRVHLVAGPYRDACCGALLGAALASSVRSRGNGGAGLLRYGVEAQVLLAGARCVGSNGELEERRYRLELGYLARYALGASRGFASTLRQLRADSKGDAARKGSGDEPLLCSVPFGLVWHDRPREAAMLARRAVAVTHRAPVMGDVAACMAAAVALTIVASATSSRPLGARRAWVEKVLDAASPSDATAASLGTIADLASTPPEQAGPALDSALPALRSLRWGLYLALRFSQSPEDGLDTLLTLRSVSPAALGFAGAIVGALAGADEVEQRAGRLPDRQQFIAWGEKLALIAPP